jgi:acyl dehydratase
MKKDTRRQAEFRSATDIFDTQVRALKALAMVLSTFEDESPEARILADEIEHLHPRLVAFKAQVERAVLHSASVVERRRLETLADELDNERNQLADRCRALVAELKAAQC